MDELRLTARKLASLSCRSVRSRINPVKNRWLAVFTSPTLHLSGKVEPSLRSPTTTRPMPMIFRSPVFRYRLQIRSHDLPRYGEGINALTFFPTASVAE